MQVGSGRALGSRYELVSRIGAGAMGEVWRARDRTTGTDRAAKMLLASFTSDREIITRFVQERTILMGLQHPNIVRVHDLVIEGTDLAIVMDLVEGPDLRHYLAQRGTLAAGEALMIVTAVLDALAAAHSSGCLHRDVKPDNVLLAADHDLVGADVLLSDFSIARLAQESTIQATGLLGTPGYMPPELFSEGRFSAASDVYAAGVLLYELLAGRTPFSGTGTAHTVGFRHVMSAPPPLPVPPPLWAAIATMLDKDPSRRLAAQATAAALRDLAPTLAAVTPLPVQPMPEQWQSWTGSQHPAPGGQAIRMDLAAADLDVGATQLKPDGLVLAPTPVASTGEVRALVDGSGTAAGSHTDMAMTQVARASGRADFQAPVLRAAVTSVERGRSTRRRWLWVAGVLAGLAVIAVAVVFLTTRGSSGARDATGADSTETGSAASSAATISSTPAGIPDPLPTGLTVASSATYDPSTNEVSMTVQLRAGDFALQGPFLQMLAPQADGSCPLATWSGQGSASDVRGQDGVGQGCAYALDVGTLQPDQQKQLVATWTQHLSTADAQQELDQSLGSATSATSETLQSIRGSDYFIAQRLSGLDARIAGSARQGHPLHVVVTPVWSSGSDPTDVILQLGAGVQTDSDVVAAVAGGNAGISVPLPSCGGLNHSGRLDLVPSTFADGCVVEVDIGALQAKTSSFGIIGSGS